MVVFRPMARSSGKSAYQGSSSSSSSSRIFVHSTMSDIIISSSSSITTAITIIIELHILMECAGLSDDQIVREIRVKTKR